MILSDQYDPMGQAIWDYATLGNAQHHLIVQSSLFDDDEMPIETLFRKESHMSRIERTALNFYAKVAFWTSEQELAAIH